MTSVFGNVTVAQATRNALYLAEKAGFSGLPVAEGAGAPLVLPPFPPSRQVHGDEVRRSARLCPQGRAVTETRRNSWSSWRGLRASGPHPVRARSPISPR
ncbi:hypothetical protein QWZ10_25035, partial [Paracoccus cavernae]|nr:hypothetical protein [Paracoccus cavernae]